MIKKLLLIFLLIFPLSVFAQLSKTIEKGGTVTIFATETVQTIDGQPLNRDETFYSLFIRSVGQAKPDTIFYRKSANDMPMDATGSQTLFIENKFFLIEGTYEIYGYASVFVPTNQDTTKWFDSKELSDIIVITVITPDPVITSLDTINNVLIGTNFLNVTDILLGNTVISISAHTDTTLAFTIPSNFPPGDYQLNLMIDGKTISTNQTITIKPKNSARIPEKWQISISGGN